MTRWSAVLYVVLVVLFAPDLVAQTDKNDDGARERFRGMYLGVSTNLKTRERTNFVFELKDDFVAFRNYKRWGKWETKDNSVRVVADDEEKGELELHLKSKTTIIGTSTPKNGPKSSWELERVVLVAIWEHQAGDDKPQPIHLWSNGRIGKPDGRATWSMNQKEGTLVLKWPEGWVDRCKLSSDGKRYEGRNQRGRVITGKLISKGELEPSRKEK